VVTGAQRPLAVPRLYTIADRDALGERSLPAAVVAMAEAGVRWIQVRAKGMSGEAAFALLEACCSAAEGSGATLWVDDRADLAALLPVGGVHLGQLDLPAAAARSMLPASRLVGVSTHDLAQAAAAAADAAVDVVALGPIFRTHSKRDSAPELGLASLGEARRLTDKPLLAIGGIDATNLAAVLAAGADTVVVLSAACRGDVATSCRALLAAAEAA
jgi:thiamine-phosphate pyrophosphorylase